MHGTAQGARTYVTAHARAHTHTHTHTQTHTRTPYPTQIENAGGHSSADGKQISALDVPITNCDQRTQICYGSFEEVKRFEVRSPYL